MEPAAPGTEDELVDFNSLNKKEAENDRLLQLKAVLRNGKYENVFELSYVNGGEHWFCKVCECPVMGRVYQHELGRRHSMNMQATYGRKRVESEDETHVSEENAILEVAPGEPVPPGFEDMDRKAIIQDRLDGFKVGPLVALEYLIEMTDYDLSKEPSYLCILCDKKGDPRTFLTHLASYNHISQYLQKHFPTCYRALAPYMTKQFKRNWQTVLQKIAEAIEKKYGRLRPFCIDQDKFEKDRMFYLEKIMKGPHFSELNGHTFVELVVHEELTKTFDDEGRPVKTVTSFGGKSFIEREPVIATSKRSPSPPVVARPTKKSRNSTEENKKPGGETASKSQPPSRPTRRSPAPRNRRRSLSSVSSLSSDEGDSKTGRRLARNRSPPQRGPARRPFDNRVAYRRKSPSPRKRTGRVDEDDKRKIREREERQKIEEYHKLSRAIESDIEKTLKQHEKNPERHPKYNEEWKLFWNRRYKELQAEGKDASKYDFKPEWIKFWGTRMRQLSDEDLKSRKEGLRKRLGLVEETQPISFRIGGPSNPSSSNPPKVVLHLKEATKPNPPMAARPDTDPEVIILDDIKDDKPYQAPVKKPVPRMERVRSHSPWESDTSPPRSVPKGRRSRSPVIDRRRGVAKPPPKPRERSPERVQRRRSPERRRSPDRSRRSPDRSRRSVERSRRSPTSGSRNSRDKRSRSPGFGRERERDYHRDRDHTSEIAPKDRSWERGPRESSFERDIRGRDRIRTVADLPWEREKMMYHGSSRLTPPDDFYGPPGKRPQLNFIPPPAVEEEPDDGDVNIVSVLRLLTALEERLGSLGPKIIDLLAQALALEKKEANSSETLLDNEINCVMFETVKEKLKGQLLAGLVDPVQERAFKKAIQKTASLIHVASERKKKRSGAVEKAVAVPGVGAVDKAAIAKQLANALVAQGKTDVTQAELEQLINAVVGMAEASKGSGKPVTAASFLSQFSGGETNKTNSDCSRDKHDKRNDSFGIEGLTEPLSPSTPERSNPNSMENLSDSDLQTLLQNFKDLSTEEQMNLINYLKKLELNEPERVERLRKFVNLGGDKLSQESVIIDVDKAESPDTNGNKSPFSSRLEEGNPQAESSTTAKKEEKSAKIHLDSEDEDYTFDDVVKAASKNVQQKELQDTRKESSLTDAKTLISNLMSSLSSKQGSSNVNLLGLPVSDSPPTPVQNLVIPTSSADFARALSGINMDNLANIVSSVQKASQEKKNIQEAANSSSNASTTDRLAPSGVKLPNPLAVKPLTPVSSFSGPPNTSGPRLGAPAMGQRPVLPNQHLSVRNLGPGVNPNQGPMNMGPRFSFPVRGPVPNPYGNTNQYGNQRPFMNARLPRPQFNPNFNPRFGGPRGPGGFNHRW